MPLYEIAAGGELTPFRRLTGGADLYEAEIEALFWQGPDDFLGEALFVVRRQPTIPNGGKPDIVALDADARVVVIEVKRDVDRSQLAQCLEYAGWARTTNLDELSAMYHRGQQQFFEDWQEFTESSVPRVVNPSPRLVLLAHTFHGRTESALEFLMDNSLPVHVITVSVYEDEQGRRFVDISGEHEPEFSGSESKIVGDVVQHAAHKIKLGDLFEHQLLLAGDRLTWNRPKIGEMYVARVNDLGALELEDGRVFASPSRAAMEAAGLVAYDGWYAWRVDRLDGEVLNKLRRRLAEQLHVDPGT